MDADRRCCCCSYRRATTWVGAFALVQSGILLSLSIIALVHWKQIWNVDEPLHPSVPVLLFIYYFYNPYGGVGKVANGLAFRTQVLASIYIFLNSLWLVISIALLIHNSRWPRKSPLAHYTWGVVTSGIIVADLVATSMYGRDIIYITDLDNLLKETGFPIANVEKVPLVTFLVAPLIMMTIFSKGVLLWFVNIFFAYNVFKAGRLCVRKVPSRQDDNLYEENGGSLTEISTVPQNPVLDSAAVTLPQSSLPMPYDVERISTPEHSRQIKMLNEELMARRQNESSEMILQRDRIGRSHIPPGFVRALTESDTRPSSRQATPEISSTYTNPPIFNYTQGRRPEPSRPDIGGLDSRPWSLEDADLSIGIDDFQSSHSRRAHPETWWIPSDELPRRPVQPAKVPVSELRAQLPWTYFQAPRELDSVFLQSTPPSKRRSDVPVRKVPIIPAPDYTLHLQRSRHRSSTRELRNMPVERNEPLERSVSDVGKRPPYEGLRSRNSKNAPYVIREASSRSPHFLRRPTQYLPEINYTRE